MNIGRTVGPPEMRIAINVQSLTYGRIGRVTNVYQGKKRARQQCRARYKLLKKSEINQRNKGFAGEPA